MPKKKKAQEKNELVKVERGFIFCDSKMVSDKFCVQHAKVIRTIERIISKTEKIKDDKLSPLNSEFAPVFIKHDEEYRGQNFTVYRMNKTAFTLVAMRFTTDAAFVWQTKFAAAFSTMERTLDQIANQKSNAEWLEARKQGKFIRREETDVIKQFVEYAKAQGSQNAERYYSNISTMENKALFILDQKYKNIREMLDMRQLMVVSVADNIVSRALKEGMECEMHYKDIYKLAKDRIENFSKINGQSNVPSQQRMQIAA